MILGGGSPNKLIQLESNIITALEAPAKYLQIIILTTTKKLSSTKCLLCAGNSHALFIVLVTFVFQRGVTIPMLLMKKTTRT